MRRWGAAAGRHGTAHPATCSWAAAAGANGREQQGAHVGKAPSRQPKIGGQGGMEPAVGWLAALQITHRHGLVAARLLCSPPRLGRRCRQRCQRQAGLQAPPQPALDLRGARQRCWQHVMNKNKRGSSAPLLRPMMPTHAGSGAWAPILALCCSHPAHASLQTQLSVCLRTSFPSAPSPPLV